MSDWKLPKEFIDKAKQVMATEKTFSTKEDAMREAVKSSKNLDSLISIWNKDGKYVIVNRENREHAGNLGYKEVIDTGEIYDKVKENYDDI